MSKEALRNSDSLMVADQLPQPGFYAAETKGTEGSPRISPLRIHGEEDWQMRRLVP